jgi:glycosyltransferase involved in cell wall biosynthesis
MKSAIDSALEQDYDKFEVIVVNDGSTDNTDQIAKSYGDKIIYFFKKNGGVSTALNLAIQNAKGEYISWLSHDDYYLPNKISRQIEELSKIENREKIIPYCYFRILNLRRNTENDTKSYQIKSEETIHLLTKIDSLKALYSWNIHGCSLLIPKQAFAIVGYFDKNLITTQDYHLWFEFINAGYLFYCIPEVLVVTRIHDKQGTATKQDIIKSEQMELQRFAKKLFSIDIKNALNSDKHMLAFHFNYKSQSVFTKIFRIINSCYARLWK